MSTTGNVFAGTGENNAGIGATAWTSPTSVTADDTTDATCNAAASSQYLVARNFDFSSIPTDAIITGITVRVEASEHSAGTEDLNAQLQNESGTLVGSSKLQTISGTTKAVYTYGGTADVWGATLTPAIVKDADFGVRLWFTTAHDVRIDYVTMAVEYELPPVPKTRMGAPQQTRAREFAGFAVAFIAAAAHIPPPPGTDTIGPANYSVGTHRAALAERQPKPWVRSTPATLIPAPAVADSPLTRIIVTVPQRAGERGPQVWHALIPEAVVGTDAIGAANYSVGSHQASVASRQPQPSVTRTPVSLIPALTAPATRTIQTLAQASAYRASLVTRALIPASAADSSITRIVVTLPLQSGDLAPQIWHALIPSDTPIGRTLVAPPQRATDPQPRLSKALIPEPVVGTDVIGSANYRVGTHRPQQISPAIFRALIPAEVAEDRIFGRNYEADQQIVRQPQPYFARAQIGALPIDNPQPKTLVAGRSAYQQPQPIFAKAQIEPLLVSTPQPKTLFASAAAYQQQQPSFSRAQIDPIPPSKVVVVGQVVYQQSRAVFTPALIAPLPIDSPNARTLNASPQHLAQGAAYTFGRLVVESVVVADAPITRFITGAPQTGRRDDSQVWHSQIAEASLSARFVWTAPQHPTGGRGWVKSPATAYQVLGTDTAVGRFRFADHRFVPIQYAIASRIAVSWQLAGGKVETFTSGFDDVFFEPTKSDDVFFEPTAFDVTKFDAKEA